MTGDLLAPTEFSLSEGVFLSEQTLFIDNFNELDNAGAEIRFTLDGSEPTAGGTLYDPNAGILLEDGNGPIEVRAMAFDKASGEARNPARSRTFTFPVDVPDLATLRSNPEGRLYRVTAPVVFTAGTSFRNTKFFQDATGGIQIDDTGGVITTDYTAGDRVEGLIGTTGSFGGQLQLVPETDPGAPTGTATPQIVDRTLANIGEADQARLVRVTDVGFDNADGNATFEGGGSTEPITGPSGPGTFQNVFGGSDIAGSLLPGETVDLVGVIQFDSGSPTIAPRSLADITPADGGSGPAPFEEFISQFPDLDPADAAPGDDPAGDGVTNAEKFVFGGNPLTGGRGVLPRSAVSGRDENGDRFFTYTVTLDKATEWDPATSSFAGDGFTVTVESASGLSTFTPADVSPVDPAPGPNGGINAGEVELRTNVPIGNQSSGFFRTRIEIEE